MKVRDSLRMFLPSIMNEITTVADVAGYDIKARVKVIDNTLLMGIAGLPNSLSKLCIEMYYFLVHSKSKDAVDKAMAQSLLDRYKSSLYKASFANKLAAEIKKLV